jgi:hypothetical protein
MKQKMNQVTPKAGTLKQTNEIQNVLRKLIASVLMLAVLTMNPGSLMAGSVTGDSCCEKARKTMNISGAMLVDLPSAEMLKRADSEMTVNLYKSLRESKVRKFAHLFAMSDARVNASFVSETTLPAPMTAQADESMNLRFPAENLSQPLAADADSDMNDMFIAIEAGIDQSGDVATADDQVDTQFNAENLAIPGISHYATADLEINRNMKNEMHENIAAYHSK